ncbi:MAG: hypothetical protein M3R15_09610 [Acidobacteriota bacterium]|nr:hypothetical protein [Acidobacteriota bacterium]
MSKPRVMIILNAYPQVSETYQKTEIEALRDKYEIGIISLKKPDLTYRNHDPYRHIDDPVMMREAIEEFRPHVLHSHWLSQHISIVAGLAEQTGVPFTVRAHSFDSIWKPPSLFDRVRGKDRTPARTRNAIPYVNDDLCLGVLAFPFTLPHLEKAGIRGEKLHGCYPVVNYRRFHDRSPNGEAVMNTGACLPKKKFEDFLKLAAARPGTEFNLYALGYQVEKITQLNERMGNPVNMIPPIEPDDMPREYKKHRWLVYTGSREIGTVGWSVAIAEAQAAGVGVCAPDLRPDLKEYVGDCGFLYNSLREAEDIISRPFPEEMRQMGFEHAAKSDVSRHISTLTDLWRKAIPTDDQLDGHENMAAGALSYN